MSAVQFIVEGGLTLSGSIRPSGNKNAALPIVAATLLTDQPVTLHNVPRIRDLETLAARPLAGALTAGAGSLDAAEFLLAARAGLSPAFGGVFDAGTFRENHQKGTTRD